MSTQSTAADGSFRKLALSVGFLAVAGSALLARATPATGYELSIYASTPRWVWAGLLVAMAVSLAVSFVPSSGRRWTRALSLALGGLALVVFAGLPIARGYRFFGHHDSLTHLGWARAISEGTISPFDLFYPGIHTSTVLVESVLDVPLPRALLYVVLVTMVVFCVFVPLCVWTITRARFAATTAAYAAFLLLPITTISMYLAPHAMSQAVFVSTLLVYLLTASLRTDGSVATLSATGVAFALAAVGAVVYHPQLVAHLIAAIVGICVVQALARRLFPNGPLAARQPVYGQALFLVGLFLVWSSNHGFFGETVGYFLGAAADFLRGIGGAAGDSLASQGASLSAVGGSLPEIFLKLFGVHLAFVLLTGALALWVVLARRSSWAADVRAETTLFTVASVVLVPVFFAYFFAPGSSMYFRVFGLAMVFVTILGSIAVYGIAARLSRSRPDADGRRTVRGRPLFAVAFACLLVLSLAAVFPSPYTYTPSPHVTESTLSGYETAFENRDGDVGFVGLRNGPNRYDDAVTGNEERSWRHEDVPTSAFREGIPDHYEDDRYLVLTREDYEREVGAYHELRYSAGELGAVGTRPGVDRIHTNGEFERYYVHGDGLA